MSLLQQAHTLMYWNIIVIKMADSWTSSNLEIDEASSNSDWIIYIHFRAIIFENYESICSHLLRYPRFILNRMADRGLLSWDTKISRRRKMLAIKTRLKRGVPLLVILPQIRHCWCSCSKCSDPTELGDSMHHLTNNILFILLDPKKVSYPT